MLVLRLQSLRKFSVKFEKQSLSTRCLIYSYLYNYENVRTENVSCNLRSDTDTTNFRNTELHKQFLNKEQNVASGCQSLHQSDSKFIQYTIWLLYTYSVSNSWLRYYSFLVFWIVHSISFIRAHLLHYLIWKITHPKCCLTEFLLGWK